MPVLLWSNSMLGKGHSSINPIFGLVQQITTITGLLNHWQHILLYLSHTCLINIVLFLSFKPVPFRKWHLSQKETKLLFSLLKSLRETIIMLLRLASCYRSNSKYSIKNLLKVSNEMQIFKCTIYKSYINKVSSYFYT